jgi:hypothetical protein
MGETQTRTRDRAARYRAKAARIRARLREIGRPDLRMTVLGVVETYEAMARQVETIDEAEGPERRSR